MPEPTKEVIQFPNNVLHCDSETYCENDIKKLGHAKYTRDPSTEVLMWTYAFGEQPVQCWDALQNPTGYGHEKFLIALRDPYYLKIAFNAPFDRGVINNTMKIPSPVQQWQCAQVLAYGLGFAGGLDDILQRIGFAAEKQKQKDGKKLILHFCKPQPKNQKVRRWTNVNDPDKWIRFLNYGIQDTAVLRELVRWCLQYNPMSAQEWALWHIDQDINDRGVPVDVGLCRTALKLKDDFKAKEKVLLGRETGMSNPLSPAQMKDYMARTGMPVESLTADNVTKMLKDMPEMPLKDVLGRYSKAVQTAPTKWAAYLKMVCDDGRVRGMFQFAGASRTRRWSSRGQNLQNLRRPLHGVDPDLLTDVIAAGDINLLQACFPDEHPLDMLGSSVRSGITAPEGYMLGVADLGSIESRVLGWITNCRRMNEVFAQGKDTYIDFATLLFGIPYDQVTKDQRNFCKPPVLGSGYMLSARTLIVYSENMGVDMTFEEADHATQTFRSSYHEVPTFWRWVIGAIRQVIQTGQSVSGYRITIHLDRDFLFITLPSGRRLAYFKPMWGPFNTPIGIKDSFTYMGINRFKPSPTWERVGAHGGLITENIVQAIARDILAVGIKTAVSWGFTIVGHVHDEILTLLLNRSTTYMESELKKLEQAMCTKEPWFDDLLLTAEGYISKRFKKG